MNSKLLLTSPLIAGAILFVLFSGDRREVKSPADNPQASPTPGAPLATASGTHAPHQIPNALRSGEKTEAAAVPTAPPSAAEEIASRRQDVRWRMPAPEPTFAAFRQWAEGFAAANEAGRANPAVLAEGVRLAQERRMELADLIDQNPRRALELAVPQGVRRRLPEPVVEQLEEFVSGRGDLWVAAAIPLPGRERTVAPVQRELIMKADGRRFAAFTFGRREFAPSRQNLAVHGVALDGKIALDDMPGRVLEPVEAGEKRAALATPPACPTSGLPTEPEDEVVLDYDGEKGHFFCGPKHAWDALLALAQQEADAPLPIAAAGAGGGGGAAPPVAESGYTEGTKKMLIIRVDFPDKAGQVVSDSTLTSLISNMKNQWEAMSYGKTSWAVAGSGSAFTPTLRLPKGHANYTNFSTMLSAARDAAADAGYNYTSYNFDVVVTGDKPDVGFGGVAYVGGRGAWLANGQWNLGVCSHEVGHNFGLNHSGFWNTDDGTMIGSGAAEEYGNPFDQMGGASSSGSAHFGARQKNYLDWLPDGDVKKVTSNGTFTYRISAMDKENATGSRAVAVDRSGTENDYWIECRQNFAGSNKWMKDGVVLNWGNVSINNMKPLLLDWTPSTSSKDDSPLLIGRTFSDTAAKIHITPSGKGSDANGVTWMDVTVNRGDFAGNLKPTVLVSVSPANPAVNATATLTATATDPNGDTLAYFWDWGGGDFTANNSTTATHKWTSSGIKTVRCIVTDMKGQIATGQALVQVGTSSSFYISGSVKSAANEPLSGVTVRAGASYSDSTDSEGFFAITDLPAGSYTVTAEKSGLQIGPNGFANPVTVGPSKQGINFVSLPGTPTFGTMKAALADAGSNTGAIPLPLSDPDTAVTALTLTGTSSNTAIIPDSSITFATSGTVRTVTVAAPAAALSGVVNITLTASDGVASSSYVWPVTVNNRPALAPPAVLAAENSPLTVDLRTFVSDDFTNTDKLLFQLTGVRNGSFSLDSDGHTVRFAPAPEFNGVASFLMKVSDQSLSSRTFFLWDFEPPDDVSDGRTADLGNFYKRGTLQAVGNGEFSYSPLVPPTLAPFSTQSLHLTDNGNGNSAKLTRTIANTEIDLNDSDWTFCAWIMRTDIDTEDMVLHLGEGDGHGSQDELQVWFDAGSDVIQLGRFGTSGLMFEITGPSLPAGQWHHVAVAYDRTAANTGTFSLYTNGYLAGSVSGVTMNVSQNFPLVVGGAASDTASTSRWFDGNFDDVMLATATLRAEEVGQLATMGAAHQLGLASSATVTLPVGGANDPPGISGPADTGLQVSQASAVLPFRVSDAESEARTLTVSAASSNPALIPVSGIAISAAPAAWSSSDLGSVGAAGSSIEDHGTFIVTGSGADIWGTSDEFRWVRQSVSGDGEQVARVLSMDITHPSAKAGVMMRDGTTANSAFAFVCATPGSGVAFQYRPTSGASAATNASLAGAKAPCWLKLVRSGNSFTGFYAPDVNGAAGAWQQVGTAQTVTMAATDFRAGLAVTSHADGTLNTAVFDRLSGLAPLGGERTVTLTPATGQSGSSIITLTVSDGAATASDTFLAVVGVNTPPSISAVPNLSAVDGESIPSIPFEIGDLHTPATSLTLTASSSNPQMLPASRITLSGTGASRVLQLRPIPSETGAVTITLSVSDGQILTTQTFTLTINPGAPEIFLRAGANWKFLDTGANPAGWQLPGFADAAWASGPGQLGFGDGDENTLVAATSSRITTYFRRVIQIPDPWNYSVLKLHMVRDDGAVVYLNGQEIVRDNMPAGPVTGSTQALIAAPTAEENAVHTYTVANPPLLPGANVLAVSVHQKGTTSSDLSFDLQVEGANPEPIAAIPAGAVWKYLDDGTDPGATWKDPAFVETAAWKSGPAQLGYGDLDEVTVIDGGPTSSRYPTCYFRTTFVIADATRIAQMVVKLLRDDGAAVYLNGSEVMRDNLPAGALTHSTLASSSIGGAAENEWRGWRIDPALLVSGTNVLAVEVHQSSATSSDVSFDLQLTAIPHEALPPMECACAPATVTVSWPAWGSDWILQSSPDLNVWTTVAATPQETAGRRSVSLPRPAVQTFYRLLLP